MVSDLDVSVGLVIQGPLMSHGYSGASAMTRSWSEADKIDYDCTGNVIDMFRRFGGLFRSITCVTWDDQDASRLMDGIGAESVLQIRDTTKRREWDGGFHSNKYRQALSTLAGATWAAENQCDVVLKVRTDQAVDVECLRQRLIDLHRDGRLVNRIAVSHFLSDRPTELPDFYFGGHSETLVKACRDYLTLEQFDEQVHRDYFFKWAWILRGTEFGLPLAAYFPRGKPRTRDQRELLHRAWNEIYTPLPASVRTSVVWRGEPLVQPLGAGQAEAESSPEFIRAFLASRFPLDGATSRYRRGDAISATNWPALINVAFGEGSAASRASSVVVRSGRWIRHPARALEGIRRRAVGAKRRVATIGDAWADRDSVERDPDRRSS